MPLCAQTRPIVSAIGIAAICMSSPSLAQQGPGEPPVDVAKPLVETVVDYDIYTGRFEAVDRVELRARVSGYLDKIGFKDGDIVEKDQVLFVIDQRPFEASVSRAEAQLASTKASLELAQIELDRATQLAERNVGTIQEVDKTQAALSEAVAQVLIAEAELVNARLDLEFTEIRAPFTGRISDAKVDPGNLVSGGANGSTLLTTIVKTDPIFFTFTASEADYLRYSRLALDGSRKSSRTTENPVAVRLMDETDFLHEGVMEFVDNELDPNSGTITGRALIENPEAYLVPGVFGRLRLPGSGAYQALLIPEEAILADQSRKIVMVVDADGVVSPRPIIPGQAHFGLRVVKSGLTADDSIVVVGVQRARPGQKVTANEITLERRN